MAQVKTPPPVIVEEPGGPAVRPGRIYNRKLKLTPELANEILDNLRAGNTIKTVAGAAGISDDTFFQWLRWGEEDLKAKKDNALTRFALDVKKARHEAEARCVQIIANAAIETWTAAAWLLERRNPEMWGRKDRVTLEGNEEKPIVFGLDIKRIVIDRPSAQSDSLAPADVGGSAPDARRPAPLSVRGVRNEDGQNGGNGSMDY